MSYLPNGVGLLNNGFKQLFYFVKIIFGSCFKNN